MLQSNVHKKEFDYVRNMRISDAWDLFYIKVVRTFLMTTLMQNLLANSFVDFAMPSFTSIETLIDPNEFFETITILKFEECTQLCYSTTSCEFGNYRTYGHVCYLTHKLGNTAFTMKRERTPGYVSWTKSMLDIVYTADNSPCQSCSNLQSCTTNYGLGTCNTYACGNPPNPDSFNIIGNVYTVGGKLTYGTCNGNNDVNSITCGEDGEWKGTHGYCGYTKQTLTDGSAVVLKIVHADANQETSLSNCKQDGANLTTVFTLEKLNLLKSLIGKSREDYWIDARRFNDTAWLTSDGRIQPMGFDIWEEYTPNDRNSDNCTRMRRAKGHDLDDIDCDNEYSYICEIQL